MEDERPYMIEVENGRMLFSTRFFSAERGSLLHSGIFNRELSSTLASGALMLILFMGLSLAGVTIRPVYFIPALILFSLCFVFLRAFVFYERTLNAVFDRAKDSVEITVKKRPPLMAAYPLSALKDVALQYALFRPENPDGARVVEKIALQHGTVQPGFAEEKAIHTVTLEFESGERVSVFSTDDLAQAEKAKEEMKKFLSIKGRGQAHA